MHLSHVPGELEAYTVGADPHHIAVHTDIKPNAAMLESHAPREAFPAFE